MAIKAAVISTCLKYGSASAFMDNARALREGILTMRETLKVATAKGAILDVHKSEIRTYYLPALFSGIMFKQFLCDNCH
jgi:hypothetical protein